MYFRPCNITLIKTQPVSVQKSAFFSCIELAAILPIHTYKKDGMDSGFVKEKLDCWNRQARGMPACINEGHV